MRSEEIVPDGVTVPKRLRAVDDAKAKQLAQSMEAIGLQQPITCWQNGDDLVLVTGAHRLAAAKLLGWEWIDAVFTEADEIDRQLWEIDENLMRSELTPTQQAEHLAKRKDLWGQRTESGATCTTLQTGRGNKQFAAETAEATGVAKSTVTRAVARAEAIPEDVRDRIRGTRLDTGVYLDGLKKMSHEDQHAAVDRALDRLSRQEAPTKLPEPPKEDPDEAQFDALKRAWNKASSEARRRFEIWLAEG